MHADHRSETSIDAQMLNLVVNPVNPEKGTYDSCDMRDESHVFREEESLFGSLSNLILLKYQKLNIEQSFSQHSCLVKLKLRVKFKVTRN